MAHAHVIANRTEAAYRRGDLLDKCRPLKLGSIDHRRIHGHLRLPTGIATNPRASGSGRSWSPCANRRNCRVVEDIDTASCHVADDISRRTRHGTGDSRICTEPRRQRQIPAKRGRNEHKRQCTSSVGNSRVCVRIALVVGIHHEAQHPC